MIEPIVCVPARNEAERLPSLLRSLQEQTWLRARKRPLRMVLVLNNCEDSSRAVVERVARDLPRISLYLIEVHFSPEHWQTSCARYPRSLRPSRSIASSPSTRKKLPNLRPISIAPSQTPLHFAASSIVVSPNHRNPPPNHGGNRCRIAALPKIQGPIIAFACVTS
jgi:glycosyltransferase involved in cell wall biosynthesis